jgi:hypothetical protein
MKTVSRLDNHYALPLIAWRRTDERKTQVENPATSCQHSFSYILPEKNNLKFEPMNTNINPGRKLNTTEKIPGSPRLVDDLM